MSQITKVGVSLHANMEANALLARAVANVSDNTQTTVVTLAANGVRFITKIMCSGNDNAKWEVIVDGSTTVATKRGDGRSVEFDFPIPYQLEASKPMDVKVTHYYTGESLDFEVSIIGFEKTP